MTKTDEKWIERIREWKASGQTAEDFAAGQPYKASTLKWRAALLRRSDEGGAQDRNSESSTGAIRMARVVPVARGDERPVGLMVEVSGARIALTRGFDAQLLAEVVRALGVHR